MTRGAPGETPRATPETGKITQNHRARNRASTAQNRGSTGANFSLQPLHVPILPIFLIVTKTRRHPSVA